MRLESSTTVAEILDRYPDAIRVFAAHHMACVGCTSAPYHTVAEACADYGVAFGRLKRELAAAAKRR